MNFNIHNLLYLKISGGNRRYLDYLSKEYSFFKTDESINPDIEVVITDSINPNGNCRLVDNKYHIKDGYLYCHDRYKVARWSLSMDDLEGKPLVNFSGGIWGEHILKDFIMEPLIGFTLSAKRCYLLHASSIAVNGAGLIFAGGPGTGKTLVIFSLSDEDTIFLSDELTILSDEGQVYSFPSPIRIYYRNFKNATLPPRIMTAGLKLELTMKYLIYRLTLGYIKLASQINAEKSFEKIGGSYPLRCFILLSSTDSGDTSVTEIKDKKELGKTLAQINERQFPYWGKYLAAYSSSFPSSRAASYSRMIADNLSGALKKVPCYEIKTPRKFSEARRNEFQRVVRDLAKPG